MSDEINDMPTFGNFENNDHEPDWELQELKPEMVLGRKYRLEKQAGEGGMGVVWKAFDTVGERPVALKFVPKEIRHKEAAMRQVKKAFKTIQELNHQHICPVYALEKDGKFGYYVVMKWLEGMTLDEFRRQKNFKQEWILPLLKPLASALDYAHFQNVIHRDVKPGNIFLELNNDCNTVKNILLIDFGLAAESQVSMTLHTTAQVKISGTLAYMPPEQWRGGTQDARTDQYALATVAYELYSGHLPFMVTNTEMLRLCIMQDMPEEIPGVPDFVNAALQKALAKDRKDRFPSCMAFVNALSNRPLPSAPHQAVSAAPVKTPKELTEKETAPKRADVSAHTNTKEDVERLFIVWNNNVEIAAYGRHPSKKIKVTSHVFDQLMESPEKIPLFLEVYRRACSSYERLKNERLPGTALSVWKEEIRKAAEGTCFEAD